MARSSKRAHTHTVTVDWASEEDPFGKEFARERGMCARTIRKVGPGGGWPEVRFTGPERVIRALARGHHAEEYVKKL